MRIIEPRVSEASALAHFERREWKNLWGLFRVRSDPAKRPSLPRTQLVWLPHYIVTVLVDSKIGPGEIDVSVEAHSGSFAIFEMHENL
ncbi:MAG: hypothetical protein KC978_16900, partial [Candidatus Omnitrophica bacterium]|nr:hypothetical protein [Candidatus Omnitrophota bacterium]